MNESLRLAIHTADLPRVRQTLAQGASVNNGDRDRAYGPEFRWRPLYLAARHGYVNIVRYLLEHCRLHQKRKQAKTALCVAIDHLQIGCIQYLADWGAARPGPHEFDEPPMYRAVSENLDLDTFQRLIRRGADLEEAGEEGTPLAYAMHLGEWEKARLLFLGGADLAATFPGSRQTIEDVILMRGIPTLEILMLPVAPIEFRQLVESAVRARRTTRRRTRT